MAQNLHKASYQWATRPDDERFATLDTLLSATKAQRARSLKSTVALDDLQAIAIGDSEIGVKASAGTVATMSHWAFGQLAQRVGAPANYLRTLPAKHVVTLLNHGIASMTADDEDGKAAQIMFWKQDSESTPLQMRGVTSDKYTRIWNHEVVERLLTLSTGWKVPPAMDSANRPAGLYAGDHDMFVFMVNEENRIDDGSEGGLARGFFCWNTEVGGKVFGLETFLYRYVCGNHIVWGAKDVRIARVRHVGAADDRAWSALDTDLVGYLNASSRNEEQQIKAARSYSLGSDAESVIERVYKMVAAPKKVIKEAYQLAEANVDVDGSPRTVWGMMQGITRVSRELVYADRRVELDRAAGTLMKMVK